MFTREDVSILMRLSVPLILGGLMEGSVSFFSTFFLSHLGPNELAAGALVTSLFSTMMTVLWGSLSAVSILIAHKHGAQHHEGIARTLSNSFWLAILASIPAIVLMWNLAPLLILVGEDPKIVDLAIPYLHVLAVGIPADFVGIVLLQFIIGLGHTRTNMLFSFIWVPLNIISDYVFMFGAFGFPKLGIVGLGVGISFSYWTTTLGLLFYILRHKPYHLYSKDLLAHFDVKALWRILKTGLPIGVMYSIEIGAFMVMTMIIGQVSIAMLAANQIAMQYFALILTMLFAIAQAISIRMGNRLGAGDVETANRTAYAGMVSALSIIFVVGVGVFLGVHPLVEFDIGTQQPVDIKFAQDAVFLLRLAVIVLLIESVRFALFGALRGLKDTRFSVLVSLITFWGVALPVGYLLGIVFKLGAPGFWYALMGSSLLGVILLYIRYQYKMAAYRKI